MFLSIVMVIYISHVYLTEMGLVLHHHVTDENYIQHNGWQCSNNIPAPHGNTFGDSYFQQNTGDKTAAVYCKWKRENKICTGIRKI